MKQSSRDRILNNISEALSQNSSSSAKKSKDKGREIFKSIDEDLEITFATELQNVDGKFIFCINNDDLLENLKQIVEEEKWESVYCINTEIQSLLLEAEIPFTAGPEDFYNMQCAVTDCEYLIARFGSVMVSSAQTSGRQLNVFPPVHIVLAKTSQLVAEISDGLKSIQDKYKNNLPTMISLITGPSRTADIEKTLILGAHGPKDLYVFLVDDSGD